MKMRILSALIGIPLTCVVLLFYQTPVLNCAMALLIGIAAYEMTWRTGMVKNRVMVAAAIVCTAAAPLLMMVPNRSYWLGWLLLVFLAVEIGTFFVCHMTADFQQLSVTIVSAFFLAAAFGSLVLLRDMAGVVGLYYIMFSFVCAWISDGGAYFVGRAFGRHKMCPRISPKKTWEGLAGGLVIGVAAVCLYSWIFSCFVPLNVNYPLVILVGVLGSLLSVFGDLCASIMKRHAEIKDFGNLIPGHGGILDRFDSMLFLSPFLCLVFGLGGIVALA